MKTKQFILLLVALVILIFTRCSNYLDIKNDNRYAIPTTLAHLQGFLNDNVTMTTGSTPSMIENWSDDYFLLPSTYETMQANFQDMYIWKLDLYNYQNDWSAAHRPIFNANFCLEGLQKIGRTEENKTQYDRVLGEALFFRSYYFQQLVWAFAPVYDDATAKKDLGIVLKKDTDFNTPSIRSTVLDCYTQIVQDTEQAIALLPSVASNPTQPSKWAGLALLARLYLSMGKYDLALKYSKEALAINSDLMNYNKPTDGVLATQTFPFSKYNKETLFYSEMNIYQGTLYISGLGSRVDTMLVNQYLPNDLRKSVFFNALETYSGFRGSYAMNRMFTGLATDELFLIQAECKARLNDVKGGMDKLNYFLQYRFDNTVPFDPLIANNINEALAIILLERRKELLFRGIRFMDIKRLNKEGYGIAIKRKIEGQEYVLEPNSDLVVPIPSDLKFFIQ